MSSDHHDLDAERAVLGAVLLHPQSLDRVLDSGLTVESFHDAGHRAVFAAMQAVAPSIDVVRVSSMLTEEERKRVGGYTGLSSLGARCPSVQAAPEYAAQVVRLASVRELRAALVASVEALDSGDDLDEVAMQATGQIDAATGVATSGDWRSPVEAGEALIHRLGNPGAHTILTGFRGLDDKTGGMARGDLWIVAARPSMGKSSVALNVAENVARGGGVVAIFSLEMSEHKVWVRRVASEAGINSLDIRDHINDRKRMGEDDYRDSHQTIYQLQDRRMFVDDSPGVSGAYIAAACRRLRRKHGRLDLVMIDYIQLATGTGDNREQEVASLSRGFKALAKAEDCPVLALSQLNRGVESRADKRPVMSDLRESGAIEQDADVIAFLYREVVYNPNCEDAEGVELIIRKQRDGDTGPVRLRWNSQYVRMEDPVGRQW